MIGNSKAPGSNCGLVRCIFSLPVTVYNVLKLILSTCLIYAELCLPCDSSNVQSICLLHSQKVSIIANVCGVMCPSPIPLLTEIAAFIVEFPRGSGLE
jgi:hypothetical protein